MRPANAPPGFLAPLAGRASLACTALPAWVALLACTALSSSVALAGNSASDPPSNAHWIATWAASPHHVITFFPIGPLTKPLDRQTVRQQVHLSAGGHRFRIRLSNEFGAAPLVIGAASVALPDRGAAVEAASIRRLTFGGAASVVIPPGAPALSDPIDLPAADQSDLVVSLYFPQSTPIETMHATGEQTGYISPPGDFTASGDMPVAARTESRLFLSEVDVAAEAVPEVIVAFGDSITDGANSTSGTNHRWPDFLFDRLHARARADRPAPAVVNEGISGNQLLRDLMGVSALARFDRDVLAVPGIREVIVLIGINDIGTPGSRFGGGKPLLPAAAEPTLASLIAGYRQLIARAHEHGVRIFGATLTPFEGAANGYYTPRKERLRESVNRWIRTSGAFDGVIDFDAATRDPRHPERFLPADDSGDHLHPNDAGYRAMAGSIELSLLR